MDEELILMQDCVWKMVGRLVVVSSTKTYNRRGLAYVSSRIM